MPNFSDISSWVIFSILRCLSISSIRFSSLIFITLVYFDLPIVLYILFDTLSRNKDENFTILTNLTILADHIPFTEFGAVLRYNEIMLTVEDLADSLGLSVDAVRRRMDALGEDFAKHRKRGEKTRILVDSGGLEMLRRLEALREEGLTIDKAAEQVKSETSETSSARQSQTTSDTKVLQERINHLEDEIQFLRKN